MYRSVSTSRVSDDSYYSYSPTSPSSAKGSPPVRTFSSEGGELPQYEPQSDAGKKEKSRAKFAERAVHLIPIVLLLCALILWLFSNPDIRVPVNDNNAIAAKIQGLTLDGDMDTESTTTNSQGVGHSQILDLGDLDSSNPKDEFQKIDSTLGNKL